jgi:glycosyltransferase involved in cell wall biosynthesis
MGKILHVSHGKESSGWGIAARNDLKALANHFDVAARFVNYQASEDSNLSWIDQLERKNLDGITHVIQYVLPHEFKRFPGVRNIGYFEVESENLSNSLWPEAFNQMDELWVVNNDAKAIVGKYTDLPIYVMPHAVDMENYNDDITQIEIKQTHGNYHFYSIGENVPRKNLETLIAAYYAEFDPSEPCTLVIKTNQSLKNMIHDIQIKMKLYQNHSDYQHIAVIDQQIDISQIYGIHSLGDCYVNVSSGESWCLPLVDAIAFSNMVISLNEGGPKDILGDEGYMLPYVRTWCNGHNLFPGFQNGFDYWKVVDFQSLRQAMRKAYTTRAKLSPTILDKFSPNNFCKLIEERITNE